MTNSQVSAPGWYPDPTGMHEWRYFDTRWTDFVVDRGVRFVSPMQSAPPWTPAPAPTPTSWGPDWPVAHGAVPNVAGPARRNKKVAWIVACAAIAGVAVIGVVVAVASSSGSGSSSGGGSSSFCRDFNKSWGHVVQGELTVTGFVDTIENYPTTFSGGNVDETNTVTVASQDSGVLAKETPGSLKDVFTGASVRTEIASLHTFLLAGVKMAHGDASAAGPVKNFDDTFMGSVLGTVCP